MPSMISNSRPKNGSGVSKDTVWKLDRGVGVLEMVATIARRYLGRNPFLIIEMNAGPGSYAEVEYTGLGSPLLFGRLLTRLGVHHRIICMNIDTQHHLLLQRCVDTESGITRDAYDLRWCDNVNGLANLQLPLGTRGLLFQDSYGEPNLNIIDTCLQRPEFSKIDVLINSPATTVKRVAGANGTSRRLSQEISQLGKEHWMIGGALEDSKQQWFVMFGSNYRMKAWGKKLLYPYGSEQATALIDRVDLTRTERKNGCSSRQLALPQLQGVSSPSAL